MATLLTAVVVDASTALSWCFPDEASEYGDAVLTALEDMTILVPAVWSLELANAMLIGERRKRLGPPELRQFATLLGSLNISQDLQPVEALLTHVLPLARKHGLSAYDAAYLELALRSNAPLASLDQKLRQAAQSLTIPILSS